jgi:hypothetical protein
VLLASVACSGEYFRALLAGESALRVLPVTSVDHRSDQPNDSYDDDQRKKADEPRSRRQSIHDVRKHRGEDVRQLEARSGLGKR